MPSDHELPLSTTTVSSALASIFRGRFCEVMLRERPAVWFAKDELMYDQGGQDQILFFIKHGVVKIGTITPAGREIIYGLRKDGDVVGERCAFETVRYDRAVALERTEAIAIALEEVLRALAAQPALLQDFVGVFCTALREAYDQVNRLAAGGVEQGLVKVLLALAHKHGRLSGRLVEIPIYLTQEELAQMVVARRERVSTALNALRRRGMVQYSARAYLLLDIRALEGLTDE